MYEDSAQALKQNTTPYILHFDIIYSVQYNLFFLLSTNNLHVQTMCQNYTIFLLHVSEVERTT